MLKQKIIVMALMFAANSVSAELSVEAIGKTETLPKKYPQEWVFAHDSAFFHMTNGHYMLLDPTQESGPKQYKGMVDASFIASFAQAPSRNEFYVIETFYSRGARGERSDVVTIYDPATLSPKGEVLMDAGKRMSSMPEKFAGQMLQEDKFLLVNNMTPATSVTVIDMDKRKVVSEVNTPGCILSYPTGKMSFSSICGDGALLTSLLDGNGKLVKSTRSKPFFDPDKDPIFEKPVIINGMAYFPTFAGEIINVDLSTEFPVAGDTWSMLSEQEKSENWRPGGWQLNAADAQGRFYILMHAQGKEGSHKDGGSEVWVFDADRRQRVARITLANHGVSLAATQGESPLLLVTNATMQVDVYQDNEFVRTLAPFGQETPFIIHPVEH
jgi:methylamine dehydrogenase heavy chain